MVLVTDWSVYPNFSEHEFACSHCGECKMDLLFVNTLQMVRTELSLPMKINSGYRCAEHPVEAAKDEPGEHFYGIAADIQASHNKALAIMILCYEFGMRRFGLQQKGIISNRYIHVGMGMPPKFVSPTIWTY